MKLREMRDYARSNGLRGYTGLRKADMIKFIEKRMQASAIEFSMDELDHLPTDDRTPTLIPTGYVRPGPKLPPPPGTKKNALTEWQEWLLSYIPEPIKSKTTELKNRILSLFNRGKEREIKHIGKSKKSKAIRKGKTALKNLVSEYFIKGETGEDAKTFFRNAEKTVVDFLNGQREIKLRLVFRCIMEKRDPESGKSVEKIAHFSTSTTTKLVSDNVEEMYRTGVEKILESMSVYQKEGSGWTLKSVDGLELHISEFTPLSGSSYIPIPKEISNKKAVINMENDDDRCFMWCAARALNPIERNPGRITEILRKQAESLDCGMLTFPVVVQDRGIGIFEQVNGFGVNIFGYENGDMNDGVRKGVYPLRVTKVLKGTPIINLLLMENDGVQHYCLIKSKSRLFHSQTSKRKCKRFFCDYCINGFKTESSLEKHMESCCEHGVCKNTMPKEGTIIKFEHHHKSMKCPFVVYADFECFTEKMDGIRGSNTTQYQKHKPSGYCFYIVCSEEGVYDSKILTYTMKKESEDIGQIFTNSLVSEIQGIYEKVLYRREMVYTNEDRIKHENSSMCSICSESLTDENGKVDKVRDHCHLTGRYRGAAHNSCNLQHRLPKFTPVLFHNLSGYDAHLFIRNLGVSEGDIRCIPSNEEKYISFGKMIKVRKTRMDKGKPVEIEERHEIRFIDSFKFMASGLGALASNLEDDSCKNLKKTYMDESKFRLLRRKGVFPYDWFDGLDKLNKRSLPPKEDFYSRLTDSDISDEDYAHAKKVWKEFRIGSMRKYHNTYLTSDVLLLADVFENFRETCIKNYDLDPLWYHTSASLAWDALLKTSKVKLDALSDVDMYLFFEKGTRGGISMISTRHGKANNPYMVDEFNPKEPIKYLTYLDANNLYGWAMSNPLPTGDFGWMKKEELDNWREIPCTVEVDLEYPKELHNLHDEYPLAAESLMVNGVRKLVPNLRNKKEYVVNHQSLKCYEKHGLVVTKVHRGIKYRESPWMKGYIELNTSLRAKATTDFEKDFFKLMNNSVFGKTMENIRNRVNIKLLTRRKIANKYVSKPNFRKFTIFDENLIAVHLAKTDLLLDKPIFTGASILDISKTLMYDFHYDYIKEKYGDKAKLLFTDTDSLCYEIETKDLYKDIGPDVKEMFDTSNYPKVHPSGIPTGCNKKVLGMMKDECGGKLMSEFIGLRAKLYAYRMYEGKEEKRCKGVKKYVVKKNISFEDYKECLKTGVEQMRKMSNIRSRGHQLYTEETYKTALSANDDKRIILGDGIHTHAIGHYATL